MHLEKLTLYNFKNFKEKNFLFDKKINCFVGNNGVGKTNILDSIYFLAFGKSFLNHNIRQIIHFGKESFSIKGEFNIQNKTEYIHISYQNEKKKIIKRNNKIYERLSDHIGLIPLVMISPYDRDLISEHSETRRKFIDKIISQSNPTYLTALIAYQKNLSQRNRLLKYFASNHKFDKETLNIYDEQLQEYGMFIYNTRKKFIHQFILFLKEKYDFLSSGKENVNINYQTKLDKKDLKDLLEETIQKDRILQYTSQGIHRDDFIFELNNFPIKKFGSQGQQKTFLISLRLAEFEFLMNQSGKQPILLFDDIFDKLDKNRVKQIISLVNNKNFGQIFISDTHKERTYQLIKEIHQSYQIFEL